MPAWVVSATESAERDRAAIERGTPSRVLMDRAGSAAALEIERRYSERLRDGAVVFAGAGNNGGDGWVVASRLARSGVHVSVIDFAGPKLKSQESIAFREEARASVDVLDAAPDDASVVVDALLGTGFEGAPRGRIAEGIAAINALRARGSLVAALDVPSGLDATTGNHSTCVVADVTLSFGGLKRGTLIARDCCGEIVGIDIGLDVGNRESGIGNRESGSGKRATGSGQQATISEKRATGSRTPKAGSEKAEPRSLPQLVDGNWVRSQIPPIRFDAHKGTRKHLAIIGGGKGMPGAVVLGAKAALRSGIGLVRTLVAPENVPAVLAAVPSVLNSEWPSSSNQISSEIGGWADAAVIGPGMGQSRETRALVERVLREARIPLILDADALNVFADDAKTLGGLLAGRQALVTPHVAEFARLAGLDAKEVIANRFDVGVDLAQTLNCAVLLKGSPTVIFSPRGERFVVARGTAALGTGGSGDLLAGIAGTLLAQTADATVAASCAAWVHGRAAELCEYVRGTTLDDVLYALPRAWNELEPAPEPPVMAVLPAVAR